MKTKFKFKIEEYDDDWIYGPDNEVYHLPLRSGGGRGLGRGGARRFVPGRNSYTNY